MTAIAGFVPRRNQIHRLVVALGVIAGIMAMLPIAAAVVTGITGPGSAGTSAFASAVPGNYAVYATAGETIDEIRVAPASDPDAAVAITTVSHLPGYTSRGAVSPNSRLLALVVADSGVQSAPTASLVVVDLESGTQSRIASGVDYLQDPVWTPGSDAVLAVSSVQGGLAVLEVAADGSSVTERAAIDAMGLYAVGFTPAGELVTVIIDARGSTAAIDGVEVANIASSITRDWALSPDGTELAFVATDFSSGVNYLPRVVSLEGGSVSAMAASASEGQALGAVWSPASGEVAFGSEPASVEGNVLAQSAGFDVPLGYSGDGAALAVHHWTGAGFDQPGEASVQVVTADGRQPLPAASRFFGWAER